MNEHVVCHQSREDMKPQVTCVAIIYEEGLARAPQDSLLFQVRADSAQHDGTVYPGGISIKDRGTLR